MEGLGASWRSVHWTPSGSSLSLLAYPSSLHPSPKGLLWSCYCLIEDLGRVLLAGAAREWQSANIGFLREKKVLHAPPPTALGVLFLVLISQLSILNGGGISYRTA